MLEETLAQTPVAPVEGAPVAVAQMEGAQTEGAQTAPAAQSGRTRSTMQTSTATTWARVMMVWKSQRRMCISVLTNVFISPISHSPLQGHENRRQREHQQTL